MKPSMVVCALIGLATAGCTSTWVNGVSSSADGKRVTVVGAKLSNVGFGWDPSNALRWECIRGDAGKLSCRAIERQLPKP
jgi:hypothetical protein